MGIHGSVAPYQGDGSNRRKPKEIKSTVDSPLFAVSKTRCPKCKSNKVLAHNRGVCAFCGFLRMVRPEK